jgi:DNA invertase Pin-like site-specific DNA recombinase
MDIAYVRISKKEENVENQIKTIREFAGTELVFFQDILQGLFQQDRGLDSEK